MATPRHTTKGADVTKVDFQNKHGTLPIFNEYDLILKCFRLSIQLGLVNLAESNTPHINEILECKIVTFDPSLVTFRNLELELGNASKLEPMLFP